MCTHASPGSAHSSSSLKLWESFDALGGGSHERSELSISARRAGRLAACATNLLPETMAVQQSQMLPCRGVDGFAVGLPQNLSQGTGWNPQRDLWTRGWAGAIKLHGPDTMVVIA